MQSEKKISSQQSRKSIKQQAFRGTNFRWINAAIYCESLQKIILASDDHQISIYDSSNMVRIISFVRGNLIQGFRAPQRTLPRLSSN